MLIAEYHHWLKRPLFCVTKRQWDAATVGNDEFLAPDGRVMEMLSEHHNGFSHQFPGFIDHVVNMKAEVVKVYPAAGCQLFAVGDGPLFKKSSLCQCGDCWKTPRTIIGERKCQPFERDATC